MSKLVGFATLAALTTLAQIGCSSASPSSGPSAQAATPDAGDFDAAAVAIQCTAPTGAPITHTGELKADETWSADSVHLVPHDFNILANVTIAPCAQVQIGDAATITVGAGASIKGEGTASQPITIGAADSAKPWATIRTVGGNVRLAHATVSDGGLPASNSIPDTVGAFFGQTSGNAGAVTTAYSFDHVVIQGSRSNGIVLDGVDLDPVSTALTITRSAQFPIRLSAAAIGSVPEGTYTGNGDNAILVIGGVGQGLSIVRDTTVHDRGVPYQIGDGQSNAELRIGNGGPLATVTIEPNVTMAFKKGGGLFVEFAATSNPASGALIAKGSAAMPITFTSAEPAPAPGDWVGVAFDGVPAASDALDHVVIEFAGGDSSTIEGCPLNTQVKAALLLLGGQPSSGFLTNSTIKSSARDATFRGWIGADIDFGATNTFENVPGCHETNVLVAQGVCPKTACQ